MSEEKKEKKMNGLGFYLVLLLTITDDIIDILLNLSVVLSIITSLTSIFISFIVWLYLKSNGVKMDTQKIAIWILAFIVEVFPFASAIPSSTSALLLTKKIVNGDIPGVGDKK